MGLVRATIDEAERDLATDAEGCAKQGGYSDRAVYAIDHEGYVVDVDDPRINVYPYGRTSAALKLGRGDAQDVPAWMAAEVQP
jgi:hypothetical protein